MNIKERKTFSLYTSKKFFIALDYLSKKAKKSKGAYINNLLKKDFDENKNLLAKKKIDYE